MKGIVDKFEVRYYFGGLASNFEAWQLKLMEDSELIQSILEFKDNGTWYFLSNLAKHPGIRGKDRTF